MASLRSRGHPSRRTTILFLGVAAAAVAALIWMGVRLLQQDRALEAQQLRERREAAADRLIIALEQVLSAEERRLTDLPRADVASPADDAVWITEGVSNSSEFHVWPDIGLLYYPVIPPGQEPPARRYVEAERWEFIHHNYRRAAEKLRPLTRTADPAVRAGAQLRLARNLRKAGDLESALEIYAELAESSDQGVLISGVPADLAARRARCALLEELGRRAELEEEARHLRDELMTGCWRLDRASYLYYRDQAARWLNQEPGSDAEQQALADAVIWLWENRQDIGDVEPGSEGRRSFRLHGTPVTVLWRQSKEQLAAVIAGPGYQRSRWFDPILGSADFGSIRVGVRDSDNALVYGNEPAAAGVPATSRLASVTGLPWDIVLVNADPEAVLGQFAQRRRLMMMGLAMLALLVIAASYLIGRSVSRELAAARLQSDFVSAVSHEFRTPLTSMRQFTEMLVEDESLPAEKRRAFHRAQERATRRLSRLVESLLDFGRMEAGARPYRLERLDAGRLVKATVEEFKQEINPANLVMECSVPDEGPAVKADREALAQALWNLLDNAVKYSGDSPVVHIEVEAGNPVAIRVRDQGLGILPAERNRILRKFVRGTSAKASGVKGTGIGLAMVKHIVDAHAGKVLVESESGEGSSFTILLPPGE
ncbi:MAG: HAMP domain-containing histidine kinase [Candidatus Aminicenantes bacterium]|nr:HAMP domain-containing histidine kinase [Candidatus Aminicenantes bacterium]